MVTTVVATQSRRSTGGEHLTIGADVLGALASHVLKGLLDLHNTLPNRPANAAAPRPYAILTVILVTFLILILDGSIVIAAMPKISAAFAFNLTTEFWVANVYALTFGGFLLLGARMGDILGRRRMLLAGLVLFTVTSLGVALARGAETLLVFRALQGLGAAILAPSTLALIATNFAEGSERTRATSLYGAVAGIGGSLGIVLGGFITQWLSWRVGFLINLPIGLALIAGAWLYVPESEMRPGHFDLVGAILSTLGMSSVVYGVMRVATAGWTDVITIATLVLGVVLMGLFVWVETRASQPIMPLRLFANRERAGAYATRLVFMGGMMGFWFIAARLLQDVMGYGPFEAGLAYLPATLGNFALAMAVPAMTRRFGNGRVLCAGLVTGFLGMVWLSFASDASPSLLTIALPMVLVGAGQGATISPLTVSGVVGVHPEDAGAASGLVNMAHQLGGALGLSILTVALAAGADHASSARSAFVEGIPFALAASAVMLGFALVVGYMSIVRASRARSAAEVDAAELAGELL